MSFIYLELDRLIVLKFQFVIMALHFFSPNGFCLCLPFWLVILRSTGTFRWFALYCHPLFTFHGRIDLIFIADYYFPILMNDLLSSGFALKSRLPHNIWRILNWSSHWLINSLFSDDWRIQTLNWGAGLAG